MHNSHVISSNQQESVDRVLLTRYTLGTATKPVGKKTRYRRFGSHLQRRVSRFQRKC